MQRCAIDDDDPSFAVGNVVEKPESMKSAKQSDGVSKTGVAEVVKETAAIITVDHAENKKVDPTQERPPVFDFGKRLSRKWTTGAGPRIGCVRDYPTELQSRALEQVNLSPRPAAGPLFCFGPIPSPRPSPKVRLSPTLTYMGLRSPRTPIASN